MPTRADDNQLLARLQALIAQKGSDFTAVAGDGNGVVIERRRHVRGIWTCEGDGYAWTPAGYSLAVYTADDIDAAVSYTERVIAKA